MNLPRSPRTVPLLALSASLLLPLLALPGCRTGPHLEPNYSAYVYPSGHYEPYSGAPGASLDYDEPPSNRGERLRSISEIRARLAEPDAALTLDDCIRLALANSLQVRHGELEMEMAEANITGAYLRLIPTLTLEGGVSVLSVEPSLSFNDQTVQVGDQVVADGALRTTFPIWGLGRTTQAVRMFDRHKAAGEAGRRAAQQQTVLATIELVLTLHKLDDTKEVLERSIATIEEQARAAQLFHEQGLVTHNDVLVANVALAERRQELREIRTTRRTTLARLNSLLGLDLTRETQLATTGLPQQTSAVDDVLSLQEALHLAAVHHPELERAYQLAEAAGEEVGFYRKSRLPRLSGFAEYNITSDSHAPFTDQGVLGALLHWSIFSGEVEHEIRLAEVRRAMQRLQASDVERRVLVEAYAAYLALHDARERISLAEHRLEQAEENLRTLRARYEVQTTEDGLGAFVTGADVLEAEALRTHALANVNHAHYEEWLAWAQLEAALGVRLAPHWQNVNDAREGS